MFRYICQDHTKQTNSSMESGVIVHTHLKVVELTPSKVIFLPSASASMTAVPPGRSSSSSSSSPPSVVVRVGWSAVPGHLDPQLPSVQERAVHGVHRIFGVPFVVETHKREPPAFFRVAVSGDVDVPYPAILLENPSESFGRSSVREVVHFEGNHAINVWRRPAVTHGD